MPVDVVCLRPKADFDRVDAPAPDSFSVAYKAPNDPDVPDLLKTARAVVMPAVGPKLAPTLFENSTIRLVQVTGAGLDRLDQPAMMRMGIPVANVPGGSNSAVAEYAVTTASVLLRRLAWADAEIKQGRYAEFRARMLAENLAGLDGLTVGVVGFGTIGVAVAQAFARAGAKLSYFDPKPPHPEAADALQARSLSLDDLLTQADVVTLHVPLIDATRGLIGAEQLARMKRDAVLIQVSRGGIVDEAALAEALTQGRIAGAAVDVYATEPPTAENPLFALTGDARNRILFAPHIAGVTRQSAAFLFRASWQNVERVLVKNEAPLYRAF
jgi:phosphoglycerate dehydrogenase-like enzyme